MNSGPKMALLCSAIVLACVIDSVAADADAIYQIELNRPFLNIHFDTRPNRTYALQYRTVFNTTNSTGWTNLFVAPAEPFQNHYVISDYPTNRQRFYRLRITQ